MPMEFSSLALACLAGAALFQTALMLLHAFEHRRFHQSRHRSSSRDSTGPKACLFVPCRGCDVEMEANLRALFLQHYASFELRFLVESIDDPAVALIEQVRHLHPHVPSRIVVTGIARDCGQKVHNLIVGTRGAPADAEILAFVDSDARPNPQWLTRLVGRLLSGKSGVVTGYRWYVPVRATFVNQLASAVNNTVAATMGPHGFNLVWGGSWAIRADVFRDLGLPDAWRGCLCDDLVVSRLIHAKGLRVAYEPHCLVASPAEFDWNSITEFMRRQYLIVRVYAPTWWWFALAVCGITQSIGWGLAGLLSYGLFATGAWLMPAIALGAYYLLTVTRTAISARTMRRFVAVTDRDYQRVSRWNTWGWPVVSVAVALGLVASAIGRTIVWRGIRYRLLSSRTTELISRSSDSPGKSSPPVARAA
jgi:ceramide glucosyltransferase